MLISGGKYYNYKMDIILFINIKRHVFSSLFIANLFIKTQSAA